MHPLSTDLSKFSDEELYKKISELNKRYSQAYRMGPFQILPQLQMLLDDYNAEAQRRSAKAMQELQEKMERGNKDSKGKFKGIIDIQ